MYKISSFGVHPRSEYIFRKILLIMKLVVILIMASLIQVSAAGYAQKITLQQRNASLEQVLREIRRQTGFNILCDAGILQQAKRGNAVFKNADIEDVLQQFLAGQPFDYVISDKVVIINRKKEADSQATERLPDKAVIRGRVINQKGEALPGVSVKLKGSTTGAVTDISGNFSLNIPSGGGILVFSYIGFAVQEVRVTGNSPLTVTLKEEATALNEIVIVGYGAQKKVNLTGAVSVIDSKQIENRPVTNSLAALQGTASGITVTRSTGQPGKEGYDLEIRGLSSVNGSSPLYIVDGAPGAITTLNPNDIASISILKDAAAAAIYGARAAGGVVLITTKSGKNGKTSIQYNGMYGTRTPIRVPERLHSWEEAELANIASANAGSNVPYTDEMLAFLKDPNFNYRVSPANSNIYEYYYDINPVSLLIKDYTPSQQHNLSLSGGNDKNRYLMSLGYYDEPGMFKVGPDNTNRINARFNYSTKFNRILSADIRLSYTKTHTLSPNRNTGGDQQLLYDIYRLRSSYPVFLPESNDTKYAAISGDNVYALLKEGGNINATDHYFTPVVSLKADSIVKGLTLKAIYAPRLLSNNQDAISRTIPLWNINSIDHYMNNPNAYSDAYILQVQNNVQLLSDYDFKLGNKNTFHLLGGFSFEDYNYRRTVANARALSSNDLFTIGLGDPAQASNSQDIQTWALLSYFARVNYNFDDRFLIEVNTRYDGSSKLAPSNRWHVFPSVSGAWRLSNEKWFKPLSSFVNEFKVRGSWGQLGNSDGVIGNYDHIALINSGGTYPFNNQVNKSYYQNNLSSPNKTWETVESSNIGIDATIFKGRLNLSGDYYVKRNKDMLAPLQVSSIIGVTPSTYNVADLKTWGWEISLGWKDALSHNFNYYFNANLSDNQNKILKYNGQSSIVSGLNRIIEGMPYNSIFGYQADGYFQTEEEVASHAFQNNKTGAGDIKLVDINGDNVISAGLGRMDDHGDLVYLGSPQPRYSFGFDFGFEWKGFDFSAFFQGVGKRDILLDLNAVLPLREAWRQPWKDNLDYWTPENPNARYPRLYLGGNQNALTSTHWMANSAYLRLKNLQLGYTLPKAITGKARIDKLRIYFTGQDLWETTKMWHPYYDPESPWAAGYLYPFFRNYTIGLNVTF